MRSLSDVIGAELNSGKMPNLIDMRKTSWTLSEILDTEFPEPKWIVPSIVQEGLVMLAGRPKAGKSWMALQLAGAVASGGKFFDKDIEQGDVLYLGLEDRPKRIKERAILMDLPHCPVQMEFAWNPLQGDGLNDLYLECERERYRLIIIDTLARVIPGVNLNDENPISTIVNELQAMAIKHEITVLAIHHTRKANNMWADPIDDVMGSTAISRALDAVLAIYKEQGKAGARLRGRGRDTEELDLAIRFDNLTKCWQSLGDAEELQMSTLKTEILRYLNDAGKSKLMAIANGLGKDKGNVYRYLQDLTNDGLVSKEIIDGRAYYGAIKQ